MFGGRLRLGRLRCPRLAPRTLAGPGVFGEAANVADTIGVMPDSSPFRFGVSDLLSHSGVERRERVEAVVHEDTYCLTLSLADTTIWLDLDRRSILAGEPAGLATRRSSCGAAAS